ncbi:MAG: transcriptional repressor LexA [Ruminococcus sp.]|nr:transcriptional repressor LexA [Ruminococcus sp.]
MKPLSKSQKKIYDYIVDCSGRGRVPSIRELCSATGFSSTSTVAYHLKALEERGLIEREEGLNRCIRIKNDTPTAKVPLVGRVTAGQPILAVEEIEEYIPVPEDVQKGRELFALRVVGESMLGAGIFDGDIIVVNRTPSALNGEIVVAMVPDKASGEMSATVKRFYKENGHIRLQPENDAFEPIIVDEAILLGKVVTLIRNYE